MLKSLSIRLKLALLAGVPVLGALALASLMWMRAQESAKAAEALGSVEDLAKLSAGISALVHELQSERALLGSVLGHKAGIEEAFEDEAIATHNKAQATAQETLNGQYARTDAARSSLQQFLSGRDLSALPARLSSSLEQANRRLDGLSQLRDTVYQSDDALSKTSEFFAGTNNTLIGATAALTRLSDDGEMLRSISGLVSLMQVNERASQEHALLNTVFAAGVFPPGTYRAFVTLITQQKVYVEVFRANSRDDQMKMYESSLGTALAAKAMKMRNKALATVDDDFGIAPKEWSFAQAHKLQSLYKLEASLTETVRSAALAKVKDIESSMRTTSVLSAAVLLISTLLGLLIARGVSRSLQALGKATEKVQRDQDFTIRAEKVSNDELGALTDAFNHMLSGIEKRDGELEEYRQNLEKKVAARTAELSARNNAMRMVLDNVEQGLATINRDGTLASERSQAFDSWFGTPANHAQFGPHLSPGNEDAGLLLQLGWEEVVDGFLPPELSLDQMPRKLTIGDRHYTLAYKPMGTEEEVNGALLVVSDVTAEVARIAEEVKQREFISIFECVMKDKNGFVDFFNETDRIMMSVLALNTELPLFLRDIHTVKGNSGVYGVTSVVRACHALETEIQETEQYPTAEQLNNVREVWEAFSLRVRELLGEGGDNIVEVTLPDLEALLVATKRRAPHLEILQQLQRLKYEPVKSRLIRVADQGIALAKKIGKPEPEITITDGDVRLPGEGWSSFWGAFSHVIRNAIDHGLETSEQRDARGKSLPPQLALRAQQDGRGLIIEIEDDGNGINWEVIAKKANAAGLPVATHDELVAALFADGLSTRDTASELSGRGVGMGAVLQATKSLGGSIEVVSEALGRGSIFRFKFPVGACELTQFHSRAPGARPSIMPRPPPSKAQAKSA